MNLIIPTYEEREKIKKERMENIDSIMGIHDIRLLNILSVKAKRYQCDEVLKYPMRLDEFVEMLDFPMIARLYDLFKNEQDGLIVNDQIKGLLSDIINRLTEVENEDTENDAGI